MDHRIFFKKNYRLTRRILRGISLGNCISITEYTILDYVFQNLDTIEIDLGTIIFKNGIKLILFLVENVLTILQHVKNMQK